MPRCVILLAWIFLVYACREDIRLPEHPAIYDLATPIRLSGDTARVYLTDYFLEPAKIKKITSSEDLKLVWKKGEMKFCCCLKYRRNLWEISGLRLKGIRTTYPY